MGVAVTKSALQERQQMALSGPDQGHHCSKCTVSITHESTQLSLDSVCVCVCVCVCVYVSVCWVLLQEQCVHIC